MSMYLFMMIKVRRLVGAAHPPIFLFFIVFVWLSTLPPLYQRQKKSLFSCLHSDSCWANDCYCNSSWIFICVFLIFMLLFHFFFSLFVWFQNLGVMSIHLIWKQTTRRLNCFQYLRNSCFVFFFCLAFIWWLKFIVSQHGFWTFGVWELYRRRKMNFIAVGKWQMSWVEIQFECVWEVIKIQKANKWKWSR